MNIVMIAGSHPRHMYIADVLKKTGMLKGIVIEQREKMIDVVPEGISEEIKKLYIRHFDLRMEMEKKYFGQINANKILASVPYVKVARKELNGEKVKAFVHKVGADTLISYGPGLISDEIIDMFNGRALNIHGGLSPWYKGAATMFWPFYFLEPNYVGTTIHYITKRIDGGNIIHQIVPTLSYGDCMHEVACKAIVKTGEELERLLMILDYNMLEGKQQRLNGKLFMVKDWRPEHLKLIYETYKDRIVDLYLDGEINSGNEPNLVRAWKD